MGELRIDPLSGRTVVIAPLRGRRPGGLARLVDEDDGADGCPFCAGREAWTPPESYAVGRPGRAPDTPGWDVRVVPNKYPAFSPDGSARGLQEVVVHGPRHVRSLGDLDDRLIRSVAGVWQARAQRARGEGFRYVQAIVNEGRAAGSSLPHSHSQLVWLPGAPPAVRRERVAPGCPLCELLERELADGRRLVADDGQVVVLARAAGRAPYELLIAPRACEPDAYAGPRLARALVAAAGAIRRLHRIEGRAPLNLWLHTAEQDEAGRHWHLELLPRLTVLAGLELGAELYLNPLPPEEAARALREA